MALHYHTMATTGLDTSTLPFIDLQQIHGPADTRDMSQPNSILGSESDSESGLQENIVRGTVTENELELFHLLMNRISRSLELFLAVVQRESTQRQTTQKMQELSLTDNWHPFSFSFSVFKRKCSVTVHAQFRHIKQVSQWDTEREIWHATTLG